ncbi:MAG: TetR/AcrR family transcriptional regulator [Microthrixaceae bacterium]
MAVSTRSRTIQARSLTAIAAITGAARACFVERGYEATTVEEIAERAARTKGAVYHHFADKTELFRHVFMEEQRTLAARVVASASSPDPVAALLNGVEIYLHHIAEQPDAAALTLIEAPKVLGWQEWRTCDDGPFRRELVATLTAIDTAGRLRGPTDVQALADALLGAITECARCVASSEDPPATAARHAATIRQVVADLTRP